MTPEGHNDLLPTLERILREADNPLDCNQLFDMPAVRAIAPSANRVSDYLGILFRRGKLTRVASDAGREMGARARWAYMWRDKEMPAWKQPKEVIEYRPKHILDRPSIYISEDGDNININIELPNLSIVIKKK